MAGRTFLLLAVPFARLATAVALPQMVNEVMVMTTITLLPGQTAPSTLPDSSDESFSSSWSGNNGPVVESKFSKHQSGGQGQTFQQDQAQVLQQQPAPSSTIPVQQPQPSTQTTPSTTGDNTTGDETTGDETTGDDNTTGAGSCTTTAPSNMSPSWTATTTIGQCTRRTISAGTPPSPYTRSRTARALAVVPWSTRKAKALAKT